MLLRLADVLQSSSWSLLLQRLHCFSQLLALLIDMGYAHSQSVSEFLCSSFSESTKATPFLLAKASVLPVEEPVQSQPSETFARHQYLSDVAGLIQGNHNDIGSILSSIANCVPFHSAGYIASELSFHRAFSFSSSWLNCSSNSSNSCWIIIRPPYFLLRIKNKEVPLERHR